MRGASERVPGSHGDPSSVGPFVLLLRPVAFLQVRGGTNGVFRVCQSKLKVNTPVKQRRHGHYRIEFWEANRRNYERNDLSLKTDHRFQGKTFK